MKSYSIDFRTVRSFEDLVEAVNVGFVRKFGDAWSGNLDAFRDYRHTRGDTEENALKLLWCWRCKAEVPMLDDGEYTIVSKLYHDIMRAIKLAKTGVPPDSADVVLRYPLK